MHVGMENVLVCVTLLQTGLFFSMLTYQVTKVCNVPTAFLFLDDNAQNVILYHNIR